MKWKVVAVVLAVLTLIAGPGLFQKYYDAEHGEGALQRRVLYGPEQTTASVAVSLAVQDDGRIVASDGTEVGRVAETQVISSTIFSMTVNTADLSTVGPVEIVLGDGLIRLSTYYRSDWGKWVLDVQVQHGPMEYDFFQVPGDENNVVSGLEISGEIKNHIIDRETSSSPTSPRDSSPAYAAEVDAKDTLVSTATGDTEITLTAGEATLTWTETDSNINPVVQWGTQAYWETSGLQVGTYYEFRDISYRGGPVDCSEMVIESDGAGGQLQLVGSGNGCDLIMAAPSSGWAAVSAAVRPPFNVDFSAFGVWDRDGNLLPDLLCWGGFVKSALYPVTEKEGYAYGAEVPLTVSEIRGLGAWSQKIGNNSWTTNGEDDKWQLWSNPMQFTIDEDSAKAHGLNPDDLTVELRVPPLSATACNASPDVSGIATLSFNDGLGIYGPEDGSERALDHESWQGDANTISPDSSGAFEVMSGKGSLTLQMPNNFGSRLLAVPQQNFPDGMPGWPLQYLFHKAGIYRDYDGATCPKGGTHSEPLEARYCWRGVPCIDVGLSVPSPTNDPIMATVKCRTWSITDTHVTDSTRQEDAEASPTYHEWTYVVRYINEANYIYLGTPEEGGGEPDLEDVYEIALTNIPGGEHTIEEPTFARDPLSSEDMTLKIFESPLDNYEHGGFSARVDHVCHYALMDSHETNGGHSTKIEPTVRMWDHLHSPPTAQMPVDITTAFGRGSIVSLLDQVTEAFSCVGSDAIFDSHYKDVDDNYMTSGYAFDFCYPLDAEKPLEQPVGDINFACRAGSWTIVAGPEYAVYTDKVVEGKMHGYMLIKDDLIANVLMLGRNLPEDSPDPDSPISPGVLREPTDGGDREMWWTGTTDSAGYWVTSSGEVYESSDPDVLWSYIADQTTSRFATREYAYADITFVITEIKGRFALICCLPSNRLVHFYSHGEGIYHIYSSEPRQYWLDSSATQAGYANPHQDTDNPVDDHPSAFYNAKGRLGLFFVREGSVYYQYSDDMGGTWSEEAAVLAGYDVGFVWRDPFDVSPRLHFVGITSAGVVEYSSSFDEAATWETAVQITTGATVVQPSGFTNVNNRICVVFHKDGEEVMWYSDDGQTFTEAT